MEFICYAELPDKADSLFADAAKESIFFSRPWFENLIRNAPDDRRDFLFACVIEDDDVLALLPLEQRGTGHWYALTNLYSSLYTLLLAEPRRQEVIECLARGLVNLSFTTLRLDPIAENDSNLQELQQALETLGVSCHRAFRLYNWFHQTRGETFRDYMAARPARVRNTIARKVRKLEREHGYTIRLFTDSDLQQGIADYNAVYSRSWKANELYGSFVDGLAYRLAESGWLRLALLYIGKQPVAAQFWFVVHGKASIFKLVYDNEWRHYSPGSILTSYLMEHVIDTDRIEEIDFLTGNDAYKQDWMSERRERWTLYCIIRRGPESRTTQWLNRFRDFFRKETLEHKGQKRCS
ncbi:GNAT family N-acetyltransferase [Sedimenticola sp.]|uniref:GNAT family N-acetyltransferase n=1 Tax=Sedimenticola sp. TaxID=1940285 RepID=UPI003D09F105